MFFYPSVSQCASPCFFVFFYFFWSGGGCVVLFIVSTTHPKPPHKVSLNYVVIKGKICRCEYNQEISFQFLANIRPYVFQFSISIFCEYKTLCSWRYYKSIWLKHHYKHSISQSILCSLKFILSNRCCPSVCH